MAKVNKIQQKILEFLSSKKASVRDSLIEGVEDSETGKYAVSRTLKGLKEGGLVEEIDTERSSFYKITPEGRNKLRNIKLSSPTSLVSTNWDGFWRIVILDLPEERKSERNSLRYILKKAGFVCLKNSVWFSPYPLEHLFMNIKKDMGLGDEMIILVTQYIDPISEEKLLEVFKG
jgi:DNA-binding transcriptional regulator PaaX